MSILVNHLVNYLILVTRPAATVVPCTLNITRPNCLISLYNSMQIGLWVTISTIALEFFGKHRGFFFTTSPVLLCNCAINFVITAGSISDCRWMTTGIPFVIGFVIVKITMCAWKHDVTGIGWCTLLTISPMAIFCWSTPERINAGWSPAKAWVVGDSSIWIPKMKILFY